MTPFLKRLKECTEINCTPFFFIVYAEFITYSEFCAVHLSKIMKKSSFTLKKVAIWGSYFKKYSDICTYKIQEGKKFLSLLFFEVVFCKENALLFCT